MTPGARTSRVAAAAAARLGLAAVGVVVVAAAVGRRDPRGPVEHRRGAARTTPVGRRRSPAPPASEASWVIAREPAAPARRRGRSRASVPSGAHRGVRGPQLRRRRHSASASTSRRTRAVYHVDAYRMGWYQGKGARLVWSSGTIARGRVQPACQLTAGINLVSCANWHALVLARAHERVRPGRLPLQARGLGPRPGLRPAHRLEPDEPRDVPDHEPDVHRGGLERLRGLLVLPGRGPVHARRPGVPGVQPRARGLLRPSLRHRGGVGGLPRRRVPARAVLRASTGSTSPTSPT